MSHAEPAESAESGSTVGGAGERSESEGVSRAVSAEAKPHAEPAEKMPSAEPEPKAKGDREASPPDRAERGERSEPSVNSEPAAPRAAKPRAPNPARSGGRCARRPPLRTEVSLIDGSILKGTLRQHAIPARSRNLGDIRVRLGKVESIAFGKPGAPAKIAFRNGDALSVRFPADRAFVTMDTLVGRVRVPFDKISSLSFDPPHSAFSIQHSALLYHCTFDSPSSISRPAAGPAGAFLGGEFVPGKKGRALLVKARTPAAEVPFPTGLMQPEGCIEFWARIPGATKETRFPDGGNPMFFSMGVGKWVNTFVKYTANDGFGTGGLHADLPGSAYVSSLPSWGGTAAYPDFLGDPSAWHHYALVWSEKGLDAASEALGRRVVSALYVDGRLMNPAYGTNGPDRARFLRQFADEPVVLGFPFLRERQDPRQGQVDYLIDEFKIWSAPVVRTE